MEKIADTTSRISGIISNLKTFSHEPVANDKKWISLNGVIFDALANYQENFDTNEIKIDIRIDSEIEIFCRKKNISKVFQNLFNNSYRAILKNDTKWIRIEVLTSNKTLKVLFTDSGKEIDESIRGNLMNPFITSKNDGQGTGLGLSLSTNIMERHNGRIYLNELSENTQFVLVFPMKQ